MQAVNKNGVRLMVVSTSAQLKDEISNGALLNLVTSAREQWLALAKQAESMQKLANAARFQYAALRFTVERLKASGA